MISADFSRFLRALERGFGHAAFAGRAVQGTALREDGRSEALDDTSNEWPDILRGHQDRRLALAVSLLEAFANERDKFRDAINARVASITGLREPVMLSAMFSRG